MKTPNLIDVPKTHPSKADKLNAFKEANKIWTYRGNIPRKDHPWAALLLPGNPHCELPYQEDMDGKQPVEIIAGYCRILDEAGFLCTGETEVGAIRELCAQRGIVCPV